MMKFEKAPDGSWVKRVERAPTQAWGQGQAHPKVEKEAEIQEMEGGVDSQRGFQQREPKLYIHPLKLEGVKFEASFSESTYIAGPSSQPSFIEPPHAPNHMPWMDLFAHISSLGTRMEELAVVSDTRFYSMEDCIDQYQTSFTSQFEHLQQRFEHIKERMDQQQATFEHLQQSIKHIESRQESQHEEMMAYLRSVFPSPHLQP